MKKTNRLLFSLLSVYLGIALIILPILLGSRFSIYGLIDILPYFGIIITIISLIQGIYQKFQNKLMNTFDYGNKMNIKGITHLGVIDDKAFDFYNEIFADAENIDIIYNSEFKNSHIELFLLTILNEKKKNIRVVFTNYRAKNSINNDAINHYIRKGKYNNENFRHSDINISNIIAIFDGKICVFYNNDISDGSIFYTVINSVNPNYEIYKELFLKSWDESRYYEG